MKEILLYHGGKEVIEFPEIRKTKYRFENTKI